jgi:Peptidase C39 family
MFKRLAKPDPMANGTVRAAFGALKEEALRVGLKAGVGTINVTTSEKMFGELGWFVEEKKVPFITRQSLSAQERSVGHYRVVLTVEPHLIIVHDPAAEIGHVPMSIDEFFELWQPQKDVPGGTGIWIGRAGLPEIGQ